MKMTLKHTECENAKSYPSVSVKVADDDLDIDAVLSKIVVPVLVGFGYSEHLVRERIDCE